MRRPPALLLACLLALATGVACLRAAAFVAPPAPPPPPPNREAAMEVALVYRFYDAVNTTLRTGDPSPLEPIIADELIEHPTPPNGPAGRAGLVQHLYNLRTLYPDLELIIDDLQATSNNQVTARVHPTGVETGRFLGLPVPVDVPVWPTLEVFRVDGDQIVEHWGGADVPLRLAPVFSAAMPAPSSGTAYVQVARVLYPPGGTVPLWVGSEPKIVTPTKVPPLPKETEPHRRLNYLEAGTLTVPDTRWAGSSSDVWRNTIEATAGMFLPAEPGLSATVSAAEVAVVLEVTITGELPASREQPRLTNTSPDRPVNVQATLLASAVVATPTGAGMEIAAGRVTLALGATVAFPAAPGPILLILEAGDVELTADAGRLALSETWIADASANSGSPDGSHFVGSVVAPPNQRSLPLGWAALVEAGAESLWYNPGSQTAAILVLVITPTGEESPMSRAMLASAVCSMTTVCVELV